ncbi:MAG: hypothetical protein IK130_10645 [Oscillospiraceae bacterium]|nr:hypothetical protein [Oscillospiraceae bacterium]
MHRIFCRFTAVLAALVLFTVAVNSSEHLFNTSYAEAAGAQIPGIDVSKYQEEIDWNAVAKSGEKFAILRACIVTHANNKQEIDSRFEENYINARKAGLAVGAYLYTDAATAAEFNADVTLMLSTMVGKSFEFPVFLDLESHARQEHLPREIFMPPLLSALEQIEQAGHSAGVYANYAFFNECIDPDQLREHGHTIWMANYYNTANGLASPSGKDLSADCDIWQYSGCGRTGGIRTIVDRNICYSYKFFNHTVNLSNASLPKDILNLGDNFNIDGTVSAQSVIRTITGAIYDSMSGEDPVQTVTVYPHAKSYDLKGFFSKKLVFSALAEGDYILRITAEDSSGKTISVSDSSFTVAHMQNVTTTTPTTSTTTSTTTTTAASETVLNSATESSALTTDTLTSPTVLTAMTETAVETTSVTTKTTVDQKQVRLADAYSIELPAPSEGENSRLSILRLVAEHSSLPSVLNRIRSIGESINLTDTPLHRLVESACQTAENVYLTISLLLCGA